VKLALPAALTLLLSVFQTQPARVTRVHIAKSDHTLTLYDGERAVAVYRVAIGPGGLGPKHREGDQVTPVGHYRVVSHSPSKYRIFLRLDYPNADDRARFAALKQAGALQKDATIGGDIGIHGTPQRHVFDLWRPLHKLTDWTAGCIAVDDDEIDQISARVKDGTPVDIDD
jgi:murein L,D-transpeptidase YafK